MGGDKPVGEEPVVLDGEPQLFEKVALGGTEKSEDRFDFERFHGEIDCVLSEELQDRSGLLNKLGTCLCNVAGLNPRIAHEIRFEFTEYVTEKLMMLERKKPEIVKQDFASRRDFAQEAVGIAFDMLAGGNSGRPSEVDEVIRDSRRWVGEGRCRET